MGAYKIISISIDTPGAPERTEIDNLESTTEALWFLAIKRDMEQEKPGIKVNDVSEMSFNALSEDGKKGITYAIKEK